jgi:hypothetical protein
MAKRLDEKKVYRWLWRKMRFCKTSKPRVLTVNRDDLLTFKKSDEA